MTNHESTTPLTAAGKLLAENQAKMAALNAEEEALMAPLRARIEKLHKARRELRDTSADELAVALREFTFEDLLDPLRALEFYAAEHNSGQGVSNSREIYRDLLDEPYITGSETYRYGEERLTYAAPLVAIPAKKDDALLVSLAEKLTAITKVNAEILGAADEPRISLFEDNLSDYGSYFITFDASNEEWSLRRGYLAMLQSTDLVEIFRAAPTYM